MPTLERLRGKIDRLRASDPRCKLFGSEAHKHRLAPPLDEAELLGLERRLGFLLPAEYRAFVLRVGNGPMGPSYGLQPLDLSKVPAGMAEPCPLTDGDAEAVLDRMRAGETEGWPDLPYSPPGTLPLAEHGCGGYSFLVLSGPQRGKVWAAGDFTGPDVDLEDLTPHGFFSWYEAWLDEALRGRQARSGT